MTKTREELLEKFLKSLRWFTPGELEYTSTCIERLGSVLWAKELVSKIKETPELIKWVVDNNHQFTTLEWLDNWDRVDELRSLFFEIRYAHELMERNFPTSYERKVYKKGSVDFCVEISNKTFLIELVSTNQSESVTKETHFLSGNAIYAMAKPEEEIVKIQGKIAAKVSRLDERTRKYSPHKFPAPSSNKDIYNVIIADTRGFCGGFSKLTKQEQIQLIYGVDAALQNNSRVLHFFANKPIAGLFDVHNGNPEAQIFRERIHLLCLVNEKQFGDGLLLNQMHMYPNHLLESSKEALDLFSVAHNQD